VAVALTLPLPAFDGRLDFVTGKRFVAHNGLGSGCANRSASTGTNSGPRKLARPQAVLQGKRPARQRSAGMPLRPRIRQSY
jgi:hypothetical protein